MNRYNCIASVINSVITSSKFMGYLVEMMKF
jgi:hypothetical protein